MHWRPVQSVTNCHYFIHITKNDNNTVCTTSVILLCVGITQNGPYSLASACMPSVINRMNAGSNDKLVGMATGKDEIYQFAVFIKF